MTFLIFPQGPEEPSAFEWPVMGLAHRDSNVVRPSLLCDCVFMFLKERIQRHCGSLNNCGQAAFIKNDSKVVFALKVRHV